MLTLQSSRPYLAFAGAVSISLEGFPEPLIVPNGSPLIQQGEAEIERGSRIGLVPVSGEPEAVLRHSPADNVR